MGFDNQFCVQLRKHVEKLCNQLPQEHIISLTGRLAPDKTKPMKVEVPLANGIPFYRTFKMSS